MTTIIIRKTVKKEYVGLICMGHSGYAENKPDIVCAAVSVLVINTINAIEKLAGQMPDVLQNEETGFIRCDFKDSLNEKSILLMDAMVLGLQDISKTYGKKYLQVKFEEVLDHVKYEPSILRS